MKPRIDKLLHQRDLLREHLRWIDEEIAAAEVGDPLTPSEQRGQDPTALSISQPGDVNSPPIAETANDSVAEVLLPEPDTRGAHNEVRAGCLLYFGVASAAFGLLVAYIYWRY